MENDLFRVRTKNLSSFTGTFNGALRSFQLGNNSLIADGSSTLPDKICDPTSVPFSRTQTEISILFSFASCFNFIAELSPA